MDEDGTLLIRHDASLAPTQAWPAAAAGATLRWDLPEELRVLSAPEADVRETLRGWHFEHLSERSPLGEIWRVRSPWGDLQRAHLVPPHLSDPLQRFLLRVSHLDHPGLLPVRVAPGSDRIVLSPWRGRTLVDRILECQHAGMVGIPPLEMLGYLREIAVALDDLRSKTGLGHYALHPRNIFLHEDRVRIAGFGYVELLGKCDGKLLLSDLQFAAPECRRGRPHRHSDQTSLAILFATMTTGTLPRGGLGDVPDLAVRVREVLVQAMHPQPNLRFRDATAFVQALEEGHAVDSTLSPLLGPSWVGARQPLPAVASLEDFARELYLRGKRSHFENVPEPALRDSLRHGLTSSLPPKLTAHRLELYRSQVGGVWLYREPGHGLMEIADPVRLWRCWTGERSGLRLRLKWTKSGCGTAVWARIVPFGCPADEAKRKLEHHGKSLLRELRRILFALPDQRRSERIPWRQAIRVQPVLRCEMDRQTIAGISVDVSPRGIGLLVPQPLVSPQFYVQVPGQRDLEGYAGLAEAVHERTCRNGWIEIGASFLIDS
jgi:hypothetical protein